MKENLRTILRCTGLALVVIAALVLIPAAAEAQLHGVQLLKGCTSPRTNCNSDLDCADADFCNGAETCSTPSASEPTTSCTIELTNSDGFNDSVTLTAAADAVKPGPGEVVDTTLTITAVQDNGTAGDTTCTVGMVIGGATTCVVGHDDVVTWISNEYQILPTDPNPLNDQARVNWLDNCDSATTTGCDPGTLNLAQAPAATTVVDNCVPGTAPCPVDDGLFCNGLEGCDEAGDACLTPIPADCSDTLSCTENERCVEGTGGFTCASDPVVCTDDLFCSTVVCTEPNGCGPGVADNDCDDNDVCTDNICDEATDACLNPPADPLPAECVPGDEICRTPGFWGTHGGTEKANSVNITGALLNAYNSVNDPDLQICGQTINNTTLGSVNSALEAICASPKGDQRIQLARQLTAAALNCIITNAAGEPVEGSCTDFTTGLAGDVCAGVDSLDGIFAECNAACAAGDVTIDHDTDATTPEVSCIGLIDCFNNGGVITAEGGCDEAIGETCHDRALENGCFDFTPSGPAGSPRECNDSRKNDVIVVPPAP